MSMLGMEAKQVFLTAQPSLQWLDVKVFFKEVLKAKGKKILDRMLDPQKGNEEKQK